MDKLIQQLEAYRVMLLEMPIPGELHEGEIKGIEKAINLIKQHDPWISAEERLPEEGVMVLCFNAEYVRPYFVASWCPEEGWFIDVDGYVYVITHWMPLPEPPKQ